MFDIGMSEMLVVGVVALIVVGPKDLPKMFHTLGQVTGKARGMAREFQRAMDAAAKETGVNDIVKDFKRTASGQGFKEATGFDDIEKEFKDIGVNRPDVRKPGSPAAGSKANPTMPPASAEVSPVSIEDVAEAEDDEIAAQDLARRNAELSATEAERLKRVEKSNAARQQAADIRARREAEAATRAETTPETSSDADATPPRPQPEAER